MDLNRQLQCFDGDGMQQLVALDELNHMLNTIQQGEVRLSPFVSSLVRIMERSLNNQVVLMAVRALVHILDLEPRCCALSIAEGCVSPLCRQLVSLTDLDLAEQCIKCLRLLCQSHSRDVLAEGGLKAITMYFDFFPQHLQRRAMETCALICMECSRQVDDGVQILQALPNLIKLSNINDEQLRQNLSAAFSRIVTSFASSSSSATATTTMDRGGKRHSHPPHAILKVLHQWNSLPRKNPELQYFTLELDQFETKMGRKWRQAVLMEMAKEPRVLRVLGNQKDFSALGRLCAVCPEVVLPQIAQQIKSWNLTHELFVNLNAVKLIQNMLPMPPNSLQFEDMKRSKHEFDLGLECSEEEMILEEQDVMQQQGAAAANGNEVVVLDDEFETFSTWACDACTFENEPSANSCEICGKIKSLSKPSRNEAASSAAEEDGNKGGDETAHAMAIFNQQDSVDQQTIAQVYRQRTYLLPKLFFSEEDGNAEHGGGGVFATLCQVAMKSANPEFRTKSLSCLASLLSILPRALLNKHQHELEGVISTNLAQQDDAHIVASTLRLAMVVLFRIGVTPQMHREQVPVLIKNCLARFPAVPPSSATITATTTTTTTTTQKSKGDRTASLRRRAAAWLDSYARLGDTMEAQNDVVGKALDAIAADLSLFLPITAEDDDDVVVDKEESPPKRHRGVMDNERPTMLSCLETFRDLVRDQGVLTNEFTQSTMPSTLAKLIAVPGFTVQLCKAFSIKEDFTKLVQLLQDSLVVDTAKGLSVVEHGPPPFRFLMTHERLVCQPAPRATEFFRALGLAEEDDTALMEYSFKADPLLAAQQLESMIWSNIKSKFVEAPKASLKRGAPTNDQATTVAAVLNEQAGDAVFMPRLRIGQLVTRGRDWKWQDQDGGAGNVGKVVDIKTWNGIPRACVRVRWLASQSRPNATNVYRYTKQEANSVDLTLAPKQRKSKQQQLPASGMSSASLAPASAEFRSGAVRRGAEIDAMDSFHCWYNAEVRAVVSSPQYPPMVRVAFVGFGPRYDEWIPLDSWRLAPKNSRVGKDLFAPGQRDDFGAEVFARDGGGRNEEEEEEEEEDSSALTEYMDERSNMLVHVGMEIRFKRQGSATVEEGEEDDDNAHETAIVLQLKAEKPVVVAADGQVEKESKMDDEEQEDEDNDAASTESESPLTLDRIMIQISKTRSDDDDDDRDSGDEEDGNEEEEDEGNSEEESDEFSTEWLPLASITLLPPVTHTPSVESLARKSPEQEEDVAMRMEEEDFLQVSSTCYAKVAIGSKEAWIKVTVMGKENNDDGLPRIVVQTMWGGGEAQDQLFSVNKTMLQRVPPHGAFTPSLQEIKTLIKMFHEFSERGERQQQQQYVESADLHHGEEEEDDGFIDEQDDEDDGEEEDGEEGDLTMMGQTPPVTADPTPAHVVPPSITFNASRARTLNRQYQSLDLAFSDSRLTALFSMSLSAHRAGGDDSPVRLISRSEQSDTVFLCKLRSNQQQQSPCALQYTIDFAHPVFQTLAKNVSMTTTCGSVNIDEETKVLTATSSFPTVTFSHPLLKRNCKDWYYEVTVEDDTGMAQIGFCDSKFGSCNEHEGKGCGDCSNSWAIDGNRQVIWHREESTEWGVKWCKGDVVGVGCTVTPNKEDGEDEADIYFSVNGKMLGVAFEKVRFAKQLRPCMSMNRAFACRLEWQKFQYRPASLVDEDFDFENDDTRCVDAHSMLDTAPQLFNPAVDLLCALFEEKTGNGDFTHQSFTNKLSFQLEQILPVCAGAIPQWCFAYTRTLHFLFPLELRMKLFMLTAFGVDRCVAKLCTLDINEEMQPITLKRQKIALPRALALEGALQLFSNHPQQHSRVVFTFEFMEEIGHGHGPTLEFYSLICRELSRKDLGMWRFPGQLLPNKAKPAQETAVETDYELFVQDVGGLFPAVLLPTDMLSEARRVQILNLFTFLGKFIARAMMDERPLDLNLNPALLTLLLRKQNVVVDQQTLLQQVDPEFAKNLDALQRMGQDFASTKDAKIAHQVSELYLDNLVPGTQSLVLPGFGEREVIQAEDLLEYCAAVRDVLVGSGVAEQVECMRRGIEEFFPVHMLEIFSIQELHNVFAGDEKQNQLSWSAQEIEQAMVLREYTKDSVQIHYLLQVLEELDSVDRKLFLRFLTGSPRLPSIGRWQAFKPRFTVVKKQMSNEGGDLPTCSTCKMELKLPPYASKQVLKEKLLWAIREGQNYFAMD